MSEYVYIRSEPQLWTVGHYGPDKKWNPESDHGSAEDAGRRVSELNGGNIGGDHAAVERLATRLAKAEARIAALEKQTPDALQAQRELDETLAGNAANGLDTWDY
jgi:hypothetical protein